MCAYVNIQRMRNSWNIYVNVIIDNFKEYDNATIFEKGQMPIFKTHKIPAQAQLYYIHALCKLWGAQASSLQKKSRAWNSMVMLLSNFSGVSLLLEVGTVTWIEKKTSKAVAKEL